MKKSNGWLDTNKEYSDFNTFSVNKKGKKGKWSLDGR